MIDSSTDKPLVVRASDADVGYNSRLVYSMHEPTEAIRSRFTIDASTGAIRAISASELLLDKDANALFSFQVLVECAVVDLSSIVLWQYFLATKHVLFVLKTVRKKSKAPPRLGSILQDMETAWLHFLALTISIKF